MESVFDESRDRVRERGLNPRYQNAKDVQRGRRVDPLKPRTLPEEREGSSVRRRENKKYCGFCLSSRPCGEMMKRILLA